MNSLFFDKFSKANYVDALFVTDKHIAELYGITGDDVFLLPRGEQAKCFDCVAELCRWFLSKHLTSSGQIVAIGGGSIGDTVGLACSIYKRGVHLVQVPTTLLAMVDSAIGGKTAIDLDGVKNAVGSYFFDFETLIDADFLNTLDDAQLLSGRGEILKYRMLNDEINDLVIEEAPISHVVAACARYKQAVCLSDPYCKGKRNSLNFGHTVGHALELSRGLSHGVAVANGIYYETHLAAKLGLCTEQYTSKWCNEVKRLFEIYPISEDTLSRILQDKKNIGEGIGFVLPTAFELTELPLDKVKRIL